MNPLLVLGCIGVYFFILLFIAWITSRNANSDAYFLGNKSSPWYLVAFGMLGDSMSGVTFISVPGAVGTAKFSYLQLVLGYMVGYLIIGYVLLPIYYKLKLTSIYTYLEHRFGTYAQRTGSFFFILSRLLGAGARLFLAASVIQLFIFDAWNIPFFVTVSIIIALIYIYTQRGGIKTLVWTDSFQSAMLLLGVLLSLYAISSELQLTFSGLVSTVKDSEMSQVFFWDYKEKSYFWKQFLGGVFIAVAMSGLDQNMMQKNLSCKTLPEAQKNMISYSVVMAIVNVFFISLGVLLYQYLNAKGLQLPVDAASGKPITDKLFPMLALEHLGIAAGIAFIIGLTAATFSSADSVLTTLTTSMYIDFFDAENKISTEKKRYQLRNAIHIGFAILLLITILVFKALNNQALIDTLLRVAGYTYGPLLGLFTFGIFFSRKVQDGFTPFIAIISPVITYILDIHSVEWFDGYKFGNEILIVNALITMCLLFLGSLVTKNKA